MRLSVVCASNSEAVLQKNLLASPGVYEHEVIIRRGFKRVGRAYNDGWMSASGDVIVFAHQDVYLPDTFFPALQHALDIVPADFGVLGCAGKDKAGRCIGHVLDRGSMWGTAEGLPADVQTLDELLLVVRRTAPMFFDPNFARNHLFGADLCMQAHALGLKVMAIDAFCHHNSTCPVSPAPDMREEVAYMRAKWIKQLPIHTTCTVIA